MRGLKKNSARQSSTKQGRGGGVIRRPSEPYGIVFFVALLISIVGIIGFFGVLAVAIAGG